MTRFVDGHQKFLDDLSILVVYFEWYVSEAIVVADGFHQLPVHRPKRVEFLWNKGLEN